MTSFEEVQNTVAATGQEQQGPGRISAMWQVLVAPAETFRALIERPTWWVPFVAGAIVVALVSAILVDKIDLHRAVETQYQSYGQPVSEQQTAQAVEMQKKMQPLLPMFGVLGYAFIFFGASLVLAIAAQLAGSPRGYKTVLSIFAYAQVPTVIASLIAAIVALSKPAASLTYVEAQTLVKSSVAAFLGTDANAALKSVATSIDVFSLATLALLSIGFQYLPGLSRRVGAAIPVGLWIAYLGLKFGWAVLMG